MLKGRTGNGRSFLFFRKEKKTMQKIKNLTQFKQLCSEEMVTFVIEKHYVKPEYTGQIRIIQEVETNGFYTGIAEEPEHKLSKCNEGKGIWCRFGQAKDWKFCDDGLICISTYGNRVMDIRLKDM
jgi:hypothetical protein